MHFVYCSDNPVFHKNKLENRVWSDRFPGSGWIHILHDLVKKQNFDFSSGDIALFNIATGKWKSSDVYVIQDLNSNIGLELLNLGAIPFAITCFESPLYAWEFYDQTTTYCKKYKHQLGFFSENSTNDLFRFPSYYRQELIPLTENSWEARKNAVLVAANKYKSNKFYVPKKPGLREISRIIKYLGIKYLSPSYSSALCHSLSDSRLELINLLMNDGGLDIYGQGWASLDILPMKWRDLLSDKMVHSYKGKCISKFDVISRYKFSICYENTSQYGYCTEKLVDSIVAGSVPIYYGAPDIENLIPEHCFIDVRKFSSLNQLGDYLMTLNKISAYKMLRSGREYLETPVGDLHSYEGFADRFLGLILSC